MNFLKALFGGNSEPQGEEQKLREEKDFEVLKYDGVRAMRMGNAAYAVRCFQHALEIQDDLEVRDYLSQVLVMTDEPRPAFKQLQLMAVRAPRNVGIVLRMAHVAFMMEDYEAMAHVCEQALQIDEANAEACYLYARACLGMGDMSAALEKADKAIALNADYGDAYLLRGEILLKVGNPEAADENAGWLLQKAGENEDVLLLKARIEARQEHTEEAISFYDRAVAVNPFSAAAYAERAVLRRVVGDERGAAADEQQAAELTVRSDGATGDAEKSTETLQQKMEKRYKNNNPYGF